MTGNRNDPVRGETLATTWTLRRVLFSVLGLVVLVAAVTAGGYAWYFFKNPCDAEAVQETSVMLVIQAGRYDDVYASTTGATRSSLAYPVATLQQILMDTRDIPVPACMQIAKDELLDYMRIVVRAFVAYGAGETDAAVRELVIQSASHYGNFITELEAVRECAPYCLR